MSPRTDLELQLPELFDTHPVPMCVYDPQTLRLLAVNPAAVARYGYTEAELLGMPLDALLAPEDVPRFHAVVIRSGESPQSHTGQWQHRTKDGSTFPVRLSIGATDLGGRRVFACILHDLSAFKRVEQQLHQSQKMEAIGQLAGGVAHDFNNLLTVIMGYGSLLQGMVPAWDPKRPMLDEIVATADRAAAVTHQLLAVSRAPAADPIVLDPNRVITDLTRLLQRAIGPELGLDTALDPTARCVRIDPSHLEQVLLNLAVNARDAIRPGTGTVWITTALTALEPDSPGLPAGQAPREYVVLSVSDNGRGMSEEVKDRIFEPFFTTKEPGKGTGLGLATVFGVVRHAGGFVTVESAPGKGSTFAVHLPQVVSEAAPASRHDSRFAPTGTETVLLVDDDPEVQKLARMALESAGYMVLSAKDGQEGVEMAERHADRLDAIVTDLMMPRLGGLAMLAQVRQKRPGLPAVIVSRYPDVPPAEPAVHVLRKPFTPAALARKVREVLDGAEGRMS